MFNNCSSFEDPIYKMRCVPQLVRQNALLIGELDRLIPQHAEIIEDSDTESTCGT